jgi:hypothetical protein
MRNAAWFIPLALVLASPVAHGQPAEWTTAAGRVTLSIPQGWEFRSEDEERDLVVDAYGTDDSLLVSCFVKVSEIPNPAGAGQDYFNKAVAGRTVEEIVAKIGRGKPLGHSHSTIDGVTVMRFSVEMQESYGPEENHSAQLAVVDGRVMHAIAITCTGQSPLSEKTRAEIDTFLESISVLAN